MRRLSGLSLSGVTLTPAFASGTTTYAASVGHGVTETTVTASASDAYAGVEVTPEDADDRTVGGPSGRWQWGRQRSASQ